MKRFPDFGKDVKRPFAVATQCYDCATFYDGCKGWRASRVDACERYDRLPDVMPGDCGQEFPDHPAAVTRQADAGPRNETPAPKARAKRPKPTGPRTCPCGTPLAKGKRYCEKCRAERRRATMRTYMQPYMLARRRGPVESATSRQRHSKAAERPVARRKEAEPPIRRILAETQTSVLTRGT